MYLYIVLMKPLTLLPLQADASDLAILRISTPRRSHAYAMPLYTSFDLKSTLHLLRLVKQHAVPRPQPTSRGETQSAAQRCSRHNIILIVPNSTTTQHEGNENSAAVPVNPPPTSVRAATRPDTPTYIPPRRRTRGAGQGQPIALRRPFARPGRPPRGPNEA
jgi:hypothetical protein